LCTDVADHFDRRVIVLILGPPAVPSRGTFSLFEAAQYRFAGFAFIETDMHCHSSYTQIILDVG
jgi:hypothetical protein